MKTPEEIGRSTFKRWYGNGAPDCDLLTEWTKIVADIQADAQQGMVPASDYAKLVKLLDEATQSDSRRGMVPVEKVKSVIDALQEACELYEKAYDESCECDKALPGGHCSFCNLFDKARRLHDKALQTAKQMGLL